MQTLFIGFINDSVDYAMKSIAIRIAYLLSARFRLAGNISTYYTLGTDLHTISFEQKIKFIDDRLKDELDNAPLYPQYRDFEKTHKKYGGSQKEYVVAKKKLEKHVEIMFSILVDKIVDTVQIAGLTDLEPIEKSAAYSEYYVRYSDAETAVDGCSKLSDLLTLNLDEEDNKNATVFVLTDLFFSSEFDLAGEEMPLLNAFSHKGFLQELNTFPDFNVLSVADLNTLRFDMNKGIENFQQAVNTFASLHTNPAEAFNYLQNDVVAVAKNLAIDINKTSLINNYKNRVPGATDVSSILLGMIPQSLVFKYFEFIKASLQDTIDIVQQIPEDESRKLVPVLIATLKIKTVDEETAEQEMPFKKTLSID